MMALTISTDDVKNLQIVAQCLAITHNSFADQIYLYTYTYCIRIYL